MRRFSSLDAVMKHFVGDATLGSKIRQDHPVNHDVVCPVLGLKCGRYPLAVSRFVITVHANALQRVSIRAFPHVAEEYPKVVGPRIAHRNAAPAISRVLRIRLVEAARLGIAPSRRSSRLLMANAVAVLQ